MVLMCTECALVRSIEFFIIIDKKNSCNAFLINLLLQLYHYDKKRIKQ